jgi:hypothetical protein
MICKICGYRNDFLDECPFHEPPVSERLKKIRQRNEDVKKIKDEFIIALNKAINNDKL